MTKSRSVRLCLCLLQIGMAAGISGCIEPVQDVSDDPRPGRGYNFAVLLKGKCFRTKVDTLLSSHGYAEYELSPPGTATYQADQVSRENQGEYPPEYPCQYMSVMIPAGVTFRVSRLISKGGDTGGYDMQATILDGDMMGLGVNVLVFFASTAPVGNLRGPDSDFVVSPFLVPCEQSRKEEGQQNATTTSAAPK